MKKSIRKSNSVLRLIASFILAAALCLGMTATAFAADDYSKGDEENPAEAAITKEFIMPVGTTTPEVTFKFEFEKKSFNDGSDELDLNYMPTIPSQTLEFDVTDTGTEEDGVKTIIKETENIIEGVVWPGVGVYEYTVKETKGIEDIGTGKVTYSEAEYTILVYVDNKEDGSGVYVAAIAAKIAKNDASNEDSEEGEKVDPTPGGGPGSEYGHSYMIFTNKYLKNNGGIDPTTDSVLDISKTVAGMSSDQTKYFEFSVTVSNPETVNDTDKTYKAYVVDSKGNVVTPLTSNAGTAVIKQDDQGRDYMEFKTGDPVTVNLKHDQKLSFIDLPVGSSFTVTEKATEDYTASYLLTIDGEKGAVVPNDSPNKALTIDKTYIGEEANSADYTNTYKTVTPTGLAVDNLPFIVLIVLALAALFGYAAVKARRRPKHNA